MLELSASLASACLANKQTNKQTNKQLAGLRHLFLLLSSPLSLSLSACFSVAYWCCLIVSCALLNATTPNTSRPTDTTEQQTKQSNKRTQSTREYTRTFCVFSFLCFCVILCCFLPSSVSRVPSVLAVYTRSTAGRNKRNTVLPPIRKCGLYSRYQQLNSLVVGIRAVTSFLLFSSSPSA